MFFRNKIDDNDYAVKRIPLNPNNETINKKIRREAQLFAKLNHEHVVRYYSAWIENVPLDSRISTHSASPSKPALSIQKIETFTEKNASGDWDPSFRNVEASESSSSSDNSQGRGLWRAIGKKGKVEKEDKILNPNRPVHYQQNIQTLFSAHGLHSKSTAGHSEFDIIFEDDDEENNPESDSFVDSEINKAKNNGNLFLCFLPIFSADKFANETNATKATFRPILYIQMEYCKNLTLKNLIHSKKLYLDTSNIWRIFREILSGLQYIHHQNMIHRDIKPMNILMDAHWSVKIGDFGLATRDFFGQKKEENCLTETLLSTEDLNKKSSNKNSTFTKDVGTKMYIAPEIERKSGVSTKFYTSKIDVFRYYYSLISYAF